jgi:hypothetical protein
MADKIAEEDNSCLRISLYARPEILTHFYAIFQSGFRFRCQVGKSIEDLLLRQLALNPRFIEENVNTIFLDGKCVDDISSAILSENCVAAFSSALPGLAGATLRRGGAYACLRDSITHKKNDRPDAQREGFITIKLFNLLMGELGKVFFEKGVVLDRSTAVDLFKRSDEGFWRKVDMIEVGGIESSRDKILAEIKFASYDQIMISAVMNGSHRGNNSCYDSIA